MAIRYIINNQIVNAWFLLHQVCDSSAKCEEALFAEVGVSIPQFLVMASIKLNKGPITLSSIVNILDRHPNTISNIVARMKNVGLIESIRNSDDRREYILKITPKGEKKFKEACVVARALPRKIFSVLSDEEIAVLGDILYKTRENTFVFRNIRDKVKTVDTRRNKAAVEIFGK